MKHYTIPIFLSMQGCPHRCVFCDQEKIASSSGLPDMEGVRLEIEKKLKTMDPASEVEIGFFGGNFTGLSALIQENLLRAAFKFIEKGLVRSVRVSTRPDSFTPENLLLLKRYGVRTVELGAQSFDPEVLRLSGRGHTPDDIARASNMVHDARLELGLQLMLGLPGDNYDKAIFSARKAAALGAACARIYPALVIRGTVLADWYREGKYRPLELTEAVLWAGDVMKILEASGVNLLRVGLHPSEGFMNGSDLIAGPFHPAFRELVETVLWMEQFQPLFEKKKGTRLTLSVPAGSAGFAAGHQGKNKKRLLEHFKAVVIREDCRYSGKSYAASVDERS